MIDKEQARLIMGGLPTGVGIVTARDYEASVGVTVNSFLSISLEPPTIMVSLMNSLYTLEVIGRTGHFGLNFLAEDQAHLAKHFARRQEKKFIDVPHTHLHQKVPIIDECTGYFVAQVESLVQIHDHTLVIGAILEGERITKHPLLYYKQKFFEMSEMCEGSNDAG